jgi:hypothetical protein
MVERVWKIGGIQTNNFTEIICPRVVGDPHGQVPVLWRTWALLEK